jgi:hypothetical protein
LRQRRHHQRQGAARQHVRLRQDPALDLAGAGDIDHAVRSLRAPVRLSEGNAPFKFAAGVRAWTSLVTASTEAETSFSRAG